MRTRRQRIEATFIMLPLLAALAVGCSRDVPEDSVGAHHGGAADAQATHGDHAEESNTIDGNADAEQSALHNPDPSGTYGAGVVLRESVALAKVVAAPESYENKIVQVQASVVQVCPKRGCWIDIADAQGSEMRVKVTDGEIVFPLSAKGHDVVVEGIVERIELTEEQHRAWKQHEAEELGVTFDPASVQGPTTRWRLQGLGARIDS